LKKERKMRLKEREMKKKERRKEVRRKKVKIRREVFLKNIYHILTLLQKKRRRESFSTICSLEIIWQKI